MSITRGTVQDTDSRQTIVDALHWLWSCELQIERLAESTRIEWSGSFDTNRDARRMFSRTSLDEHLVLVVGRNLVRALEQLRKEHPDINLGDDVENIIRLLRNVYEHWDENIPPFKVVSKVKNRGVRALNAAYPDARPWSITYGTDGPMIGGVLALNEFVAQLEDLERALLELERQSRPVKTNAK